MFTKLFSFTLKVIMNSLERFDSMGKPIQNYLPYF